MKRSLFDPLSAKGDPATSYVAAEKMQRTGRLAGQRKAVLDALNRHSGSTSAELAEIMAIDRHITARRLPDLEQMGLIRKGPARYCAATRSQCVTWHVIPGGGDR
jgi:DNA-binding MarR family transcriptional regulator